MIDDYLQVFKDPNFLEMGYYTLNNILKYCIKLKEIYGLDK
jgi:hypothetical protein